MNRYSFSIQVCYWIPFRHMGNNNLILIKLYLNLGEYFLSHRHKVDKHSYFSNSYIAPLFLTKNGTWD